MVVLAATVLLGQSEDAYLELAISVINFVPSVMAKVLVLIVSVSHEWRLAFKSHQTSTDNVQNLA